MKERARNHVNRIVYKKLDTHGYVKDVVWIKHSVVQLDYLKRFLPVRIHERRIFLELRWGRELAAIPEFYTTSMGILGRGMFD